MSHGYLRCEPAVPKKFDRVVFSAPDGSEYAVNDRAEGIGFSKIDPILKRGKGEKKVHLEPLINRGLTLCGVSG